MLNIITENLPVLITAIGGIVSAMVAYRQAIKKAAQLEVIRQAKYEENEKDRELKYSRMQSEQSQSETRLILQANESFRNEIRKDLLISKKDLDFAKQRITELEQQVQRKDAIILDLQKQVYELTAKLSILEQQNKR